MQIASLRDLRGGNEVDYPGVISTSCQRSRCAVIGRPAGLRGEDQQMSLVGDNAINPRYCIKYYLKPSRIQGSLLAQGLYRIEVCRFFGGIHPEKQTDKDGKHECNYKGLPGDADRFSQMANQDSDHYSHADAEYSS